MLNKSLFQKVLESAQWKIAQSGAIAMDKLNVYWEEFKNVPLTDEQFSRCVAVVSRRSNFFPKVSEIWEEVDKSVARFRTMVSEPFERARGIPKPPWFDEIFALGVEEKKKWQEDQNGGRYVGSSQF